MVLLFCCLAHLFCCNSLISAELQLQIENEIDMYKLQIEKEFLLSKAEEIDINNCNNLTAQYGTSSFFSIIVFFCLMNLEEEIQRIQNEIENLKVELEKEKLEKGKN